MINAPTMVQRSGRSWNIRYPISVPQSRDEYLKGATRAASPRRKASIIRVWAIAIRTPLVAGRHARNRVEQSIKQLDRSAQLPSRLAHQIPHESETEDASEAAFSGHTLTDGKPYGERQIANGEARVDNLSAVPDRGAARAKRAASVSPVFSFSARCQGIDGSSGQLYNQKVQSMRNMLFLFKKAQKISELKLSTLLFSIILLLSSINSASALSNCNRHIYNYTSNKTLFVVFEGNWMGTSDGVQMIRPGEHLRITYRVPSVQEKLENVVNKFDHRYTILVWTVRPSKIRGGEGRVKSSYTKREAYKFVAEPSGNCYYINHDGVTGDISVNSPADGDMKLFR